MNQPNILSAARQQLSDAIFNFAMSALQKAIRRGQDGLAQRAAATLLSTSPERLWRRCGCIAFEDIGVADLDTVTVAPVGAQSGRSTPGSPRRGSVRARYFGKWIVMAAFTKAAFPVRPSRSWSGSGWQHWDLNQHRTPVTAFGRGSTLPSGSSVATRWLYFFRRGKSDIPGARAPPIIRSERSTFRRIAMNASIGLPFWPVFP
jgi:hypothetical protein